MALIDISTIMELFSDEIALVKRAENSLNSGHTTQILFDGSLGIIKGKVLASMKNKTYNVEVSLEILFYQFLCNLVMSPLFFY